MPENAFNPIHEAHAIERVVFALQFSESVGAPTVRDIDEVLEQFSEELPRKDEIQDLRVSISNTPSSGLAHSQTGELSGIIRQRISADGSIEDELRASLDTLQYQTSKYTRWNDIWGKTGSYFKAALPEYLNRADLFSVTLNYLDRFFWNGDFGAFSPSELLREDSRFLAHHIFQLDDLWHSHTGAFLKVDGHTKRLMNVNLDCIDHKDDARGPRSIGIRITLTDSFNQDGYEALDVTSELAPSLVNDHMSAMHDMNKDILRSLITDDMASRIGLDE